MRLFASRRRRWCRERKGRARTHPVSFAPSGLVPLLHGTRGLRPGFNLAPLRALSQAGLCGDSLYPPSQILAEPARSLGFEINSAAGLLAKDEAPSKTSECPLHTWKK